MGLPEEVTTLTITLTPAAAKAVQAIMNEKNLPGYALRLYIAGSSCSGYQYGLGLVDQTHPTDSVFETEGVRLVVDDFSLSLLQGATVDYVDEASGSGFKITNPNPVSTCSCGQGSTNPAEGSADSCAGCG